jgi:hypothetical protein
MAKSAPGRGPLHGGPLFDTLPYDPARPDGMLQQMPSAAELRSIMQDHVRVVAGYEVLTQYLVACRKLLQRFESLPATVENHVGTGEPQYVFSVPCDDFAEICTILTGLKG